MCLSNVDSHLYENNAPKCIFKIVQARTTNPFPLPLAYYLITLNLFQLF